MATWNDNGSSYNTGGDKGIMIVAMMTLRRRKMITISLASSHMIQCCFVIIGEKYQQGPPYLGVKMNLYTVASPPPHSYILVPVGRSPTSATYLRDHLSRAGVSHLHNISLFFFFHSFNTVSHLRRGSILFGR